MLSWLVKNDLYFPQMDRLLRRKRRLHPSLGQITILSTNLSRERHVCTKGSVDAFHQFLQKNCVCFLFRSWKLAAMVHHFSQVKRETSSRPPPLSPTSPLLYQFSSNRARSTRSKNYWLHPSKNNKPFLDRDRFGRLNRLHHLLSCSSGMSTRRCGIPYLVQISYFFPFFSNWIIWLSSLLLPFFLVAFLSI